MFQHVLSVLLVYAYLFEKNTVVFNRKYVQQKSKVNTIESCESFYCALLHTFRVYVSNFYFSEKGLYRKEPTIPAANT